MLLRYGSRIVSMTEGIVTSSTTSAVKRTAQVLNQHQTNITTSTSTVAISPPRTRRRLYAPSAPNRPRTPSPARSLGEDLENVTSISDITTRRYSLRRRGVKAEDESRPPTTPIKNDLDDEDIKPEVKLSKGKGKAKAASSNPFDISPQKKDRKKIKLDLDPSEVKAAPKRWREQLAVLQEQRRRIIAPVDEMGCEENGTDAHRADGWRIEDEESKQKRERFTCLVSLMLSSQTKDEVTAASVKNLQLNLPNGLSLEGILSASDDEISSNINKVGFWRRKTGYIKSAAQIISTTFNGDVPKDIDDLCSLPGVGPKMAFLCLQSAWGINLGIGVDVHVHRMSNRLNWCKTTDPEQTRLVLQSWLPKDLHHSINKTLVGFGQVICVPVGPRCDLCELGKRKLCPSRRIVDPKSIESRKIVTFIDPNGKEEAKVKIKLDDDQAQQVKVEESSAAQEQASSTTTVKTEEQLNW
ncbi:unnamed protein product [Sympodiomycopsis kandeliae]